MIVTYFACSSAEIGLQFLQKMYLGNYLVSELSDPGELEGVRPLDNDCNIFCMQFSGNWAAVPAKYVIFA